MIREDDFLLGPLHRLVQSVLQQRETEPEELDAVLRQAVGLDLRTIDALPPEALASLLAGDDARAVAAREELADLLDAIAAPGPEGDARRRKAALLR
ncbi:MAG: hypothetical protein R3F59_20715 [Myxococcota bacterium]